MYLYPHDYEEIAFKLSMRIHHYENSLAETKAALQKMLQKNMAEGWKILRRKMHPKKSYKKSYKKLQKVTFCKLPES